MIGEYDETAPNGLGQEISKNRGEGMLEHHALDTNELDDDQDKTESRQYAVQVDFPIGDADSEAGRRSHVVASA